MMFVCSEQVIDGAFIKLALITRTAMMLVRVCMSSRHFSFDLFQKQP